MENILPLTAGVLHTWGAGYSSTALLQYYDTVYYYSTTAGITGQVEESIGDAMLPY